MLPAMPRRPKRLWKLTEGPPGWRAYEIFHTLDELLATVAKHQARGSLKPLRDPSVAYRKTERAPWTDNPRATARLMKTAKIDTGE